MRGFAAAAVVAGVFALGWSSARVYPQDAGGGGAKEEPKAAPAGPSPEEMEAWTKAATPGEHHRRLASMTGEWEFSGKCWMDPAGAPMEYNGTANFKMLMGGRYQQQELRGEILGMPMESMGILGYDNVTKEYAGAWASNMSTGLMSFKGAGEATGPIAFRGDCVNPMGEKESFREEWTWKGADTIVAVMHMKSPKHPEEYRFMEQTYTRKK